MSIPGKSSEEVAFYNHKPKGYAYPSLNQFKILYVLGNYYTLLSKELNKATIILL